MPIELAGWVALDSALDDITKDERWQEEETVVRVWDRMG